MTSGRAITPPCSDEAAGKRSQEDVPGARQSLLGEGGRRRGDEERRNALGPPPEGDRDRGEERRQDKIDAEGARRGEHLAEAVPGEGARGPEAPHRDAAAEEERDR